MPRTTTPRWAEDGQPANLPGAALDALEWLRVLQGLFAHIYPGARHAAARKQLAQCIVALAQQLGEKDTTPAASGSTDDARREA